MKLFFSSTQNIKTLLFKTLKIVMCFFLVVIVVISMIGIYKKLQGKLFLDFPSLSTFIPSQPRGFLRVLTDIRDQIKNGDLFVLIPCTMLVIGTLRQVVQAVLTANILTPLDFLYWFVTTFGNFIIHTCNSSLEQAGIPLKIPSINLGHFGPYFEELQEQAKKLLEERGKLSLQAMESLTNIIQSFTQEGSSKRAALRQINELFDAVNTLPANTEIPGVPRLDGPGGSLGQSSLERIRDISTALDSADIKCRLENLGVDSVSDFDIQEIDGDQPTEV